MPEVTFLDAYPLALRAAQVRAAAAISAGSIPSHEYDDVVQELVLASWRALPRHDATRASVRAYIERVVASRFISLMRSRGRQHRMLSIDGHDPISFDGIPAIERRADVERASRCLTERDRRLAGLLAELSPTEASRALRISRSTVYEGIGRIRAAFAGAGLAPRGGAR
ncbi:MAG: sigma-70 family RNA polymerase sigma factor [Bryobacteraceae bacterium]|nr:sigma-70 family RNA polymerase sigma factor [Bryobacteraceae bacterium]